MTRGSKGMSIRSTAQTSSKNRYKQKLLEKANRFRKRRNTEKKKDNTTKSRKGSNNKKDAPTTAQATTAQATTAQVDNCPGKKTAQV